MYTIWYITKLVKFLINWTDVYGHVPKLLIWNRPSCYFVSGKKENLFDPTDKGLIQVYHHILRNILQSVNLMS